MTRGSGVGAVYFHFRRAGGGIERDDLADRRLDLAPAATENTDPFSARDSIRR